MRGSKNPPILHRGLIFALEVDLDAGEFGLDGGHVGAAGHVEDG